MARSGAQHLLGVRDQASGQLLVDLGLVDQLGLLGRDGA